MKLIISRPLGIIGLYLSVTVFVHITAYADWSRSEKRKINRLEQRLEQMENQRTESEEVVQSLNNQVRQLQNLVDSNILISVLERLDLMQNEVAQLRELAELNGYALEKMQARLREIIIDFDRRIQEIETLAQRASELAKDTHSAQPTTPAPETPDPDLISEELAGNFVAIPADGSEQGLGKQTDDIVPNQAVILPLTANSDVVDPSAPLDSQTDNAKVRSDPIPAETEDNFSDFGPLQGIDAPAAAAGLPSAATAKPPAPIVRPSAQADTTQPVDAKKTALKAYRQALRLVSRQEYSSALIIFTKIFNEYSQFKDLSGDAYYWMADCHYNLGRYQQALRLFADFIERYPNSSKHDDSRLRMGYVYHFLGKYDEAEKELLSLLNSEREDIVKLASLRLRRVQFDRKLQRNTVE